MRAAGLSALLTLGACVTLRQPPGEEAPLVLKLAPSSFGREVSLAQRITMVREGERRSFDALLEVDASEVRVALLAMGRTLGTLTWDGAAFTQQVDTVVPGVVTAERIITDIQLAFWPQAAVREGLPPGFSLQDSEGRRALLKDGAPWCTVTWTDGHRRVVLTHHRYGYTLEIDSAEALAAAPRCLPGGLS